MPPHLRSASCLLARRFYAQIASAGNLTAVSHSLPSAYNRRIRSELQKQSASCTPLRKLLGQLDAHAGRVLDCTLPYESTPSSTRRVAFDAAHEGLVTVSHVADDGDHLEVHTSSGFAIKLPGHEAAAILTCAHTLQEIGFGNQAQLEKNNVRSATLVSTSRGQTVPVTGVLSSLPWHDLVLLEVAQPIPTLPISPYPAPVGNTTQLPLVNAGPDITHLTTTWTPGTVQGYKDSCGRPAEPGTYDALAQILFSPCPTQGTSGAPLIDEVSGSVIGVALGTKVETGTLVGYGVPSEIIYEMFLLPGLGKR